MPSPLVSVIVPTYNRAHLIGRTIASALAQTYDALEVVIIDDGSTDDTEQRIAADWGADKRVRYFKKSNGGPASARNAGFAQARGEYVALLDSDDTWEPWKLAVQIRCMELYPELGMTWTDMAMIDERGEVVDPAYLRHMYTAYRWFSSEELFSRSQPLREIAPEMESIVGESRLQIGQIFSHMIMGNLVHTSTVVLRRDRLQQVQGFNEELRYSGEDYDFHLRTCRVGPVALLDIPAIRYQQGMPDRLTGKKYRIHMAENLLRTLEPVIERDRKDIHLPEHMIQQKLAEAHAWAAWENLDIGEADTARRHYLISLRHWPWQPRLAKPLLFASLPWGSGIILRRWLQAAKARWTGAVTGTS